MRTALVTVVLCLSVVLSGCAALSGSSTGTPGVEDGELVDSAALLEAHETTLTESGYEHDTVINITETIGEEPVPVERRQRVSVTAGGSQYIAQEITDGAIASRTITWGNDTVAYRSVESGGSQRFSEVDPFSAADLSGGSLLESYVSAPFEVVETTERDGRKLVVLEGTDRPTESGLFPAGATNVSDYEARLVVDTDGRIHEFTATAEYEIGGETASYEFSYELTALSDPGVERPSWVTEIEDG
jgi:hypothetical protein